MTCSNCKQNLFERIRTWWAVRKITKKIHADDVKAPSELWAVARVVILVALTFGALILLCLSISGYTDEFFGGKL